LCCRVAEKAAEKKFKIRYAAIYMYVVPTVYGVKEGMGDRLASIFGDCSLASMITLGRAGGLRIPLALAADQEQQDTQINLAFR
jgi:hypothetical protein